MRATSGNLTIFVESPDGQSEQVRVFESDEIQDSPWTVPKVWDRDGTFGSKTHHFGIPCFFGKKFVEVVICRKVQSYRHEIKTNMKN